MQVESLQVLENASVAPAQARAIVRAIEIEIVGASDKLATKHDVIALHQASDVLRAELRGEMSALSSQLRAEMAQLAAELRGEMKQLAADLRGEMAQLAVQLRGEMNQLAGDLRGEMKQLGVELRGDMKKLGADLRVEMATRIGSVERRMYAALIGQTAVMLGFFYFFLGDLR